MMPAQGQGDEKRNKERVSGVEQGQKVQVMEDNKDKRVPFLCPLPKPVDSKHEELRGAGTTSCCFKLTKRRTSLIVVETGTEADERPKSGRAVIKIDNRWQRSFTTSCISHGVRSLDHQHIYFHFQQQIMHGFDHLLLHQDEKVSVERRNLFLTRILAAARRLKAEEDEIVRKRCLSLVLEERVHRLRAESQMWRDVALSLESVAGELRCDLDRGLAASAVGDTESACCRSDDAAEANMRMRKSACRSCRAAEPSVVLLPCRHLCVCAACAPATVACPVCSSGKRGSVLVNTPP